MLLKRNEITTIPIDAGKGAVGSSVVVVVIPHRCFEGPDGFNHRVDLNYDLENEIPSWQAQRQLAGQALFGTVELAEDSYVYTLWPKAAKEAAIIRRLFYAVAVKLGIVGIQFFRATESGSLAEEPLFQRVH